MDLPLKTTDFLVNVSFKDHKVFNVTLTEHDSTVNFYNKKNFRWNRIRIHNVDKNQVVLFSKTELESSVETLFKEMKFKFKDFWSETDRIGVVTKTAKTLLYDLYGAYAQDVSITSNFAASTLLKDIMNENGELNFTWIIATPNHVVSYENLTTKTVTIENKTQNFKYWVNTNSCKYSLFLKHHYDLKEYLNAKAVMFDDALVVLYDKNNETNLASSLRNSDFSLNVCKRVFNESLDKFQGEFVGRIKYHHKNLHRQLTFELKADIIKAKKEHQKAISNN